MGNVVLEILKSNLVGNALEGALKNEKIHYSIPEGILDVVNICNAIAQERNHKNAVDQVVSYFKSNLDYGPSQIADADAQKVILEIMGTLNLAQNIFALDMIANSVIQNILTNSAYSKADKQNLILFCNCHKIILGDKMCRGIR